MNETHELFGETKLDLELRKASTKKVFSTKLYFEKSAAMSNAV